MRRDNHVQTNFVVSKITEINESRNKILKNYKFIIKRDNELSPKEKNDTKNGKSDRK